MRPITCYQFATIQIYIVMYIVKVNCKSKYE